MERNAYRKRLGTEPELQERRYTLKRTDKNGWRG